MSQPYVGEIRMFAGNYAPYGWHFCDGALLPVPVYALLFNLIATTYGGDGINTFGLPNLQSCLPVNQGPGFVLAQRGGSETVTLNLPQIPVHSHMVKATTNGNTAALPGGNFLAAGPDIYEQNVSWNGAMFNAISATGGSQAHSNIQPYLCVNFIISLYGVYPNP